MTDPEVADFSTSNGRFLDIVHTAGLVATVLIVATLRVSSLLSNQAMAQSAATTVTGYAECWPDGTKAVEGVWIVASNSGSGWAEWHALPGRPNVAWFSRDLPHGGNYTVHVGCGGTPEHWELALDAVTTVQGSGYFFTCYDVPSDSDPQRASCQP